MLIKFTTGGRGSGGTVAAYLLDPEREGRDAAPPEVLRGDKARMAELIDGYRAQVDLYAWCSVFCAGGCPERRRSA